MPEELRALIVALAAAIRATEDMHKDAVRLAASELEGSALWYEIQMYTTTDD